MKRIFVGVLICLLLLNCAKNEEIQKSIPYIISKEQIYTSEELKKKKIPPPPIPGSLVYGTNSFIIDYDSKIYYFQVNAIFPFCGNGFENDTIPHFINLQPKDLIEIPSNSISDFVKLNYKDDFRNLTFVSSKLDTLKSESFFTLIKALEASIKDRDLYYIGRTTQEEDTVLKYKKNNNYYRSDDIKWDNKRITFAEEIKFIKPQVLIKRKNSKP